MAAVKRVKKRTLDRRRSLTGFLFLCPSLAGMLVFVIAPFFASVGYSFTQGVSRPEFVGFRNFLDLFGNPTYTLAVKNTLTFMGIGVPLTFFVSLALSLIMMKGGFVWQRWSMLAPLVVPMAAVVAGWQYLLGEQGIISRLRVSMGLSAINFLGEEYAMPVVILMFLWKNLGYLAVIFTSAISTIPREYLEAFRLESKSQVRLTFSVILPSIAPMAFFAAIIAIMNSFKIFREIYVMYGTMPPRNIYMLQHFMNNNFFKLNYQRLATAALLLMGALFLLILAFLQCQRKLTKWSGGDIW